MFRYFKRLPIATQALVLLMLMLAGASSALYFWAIDNALEAELSHARTVADMADAYRAQASKHGGFYVRRDVNDDVMKVGRFLAEYSVPLIQTDGSRREYVFHQKNPFLALGDYSAEVQKSPAAAKFKMVSDNYMNRDNQPDGFDTTALHVLRRDATKEHWSVVGSQLRYARALHAEQACLTCHGEPSAAPDAVRTQYRPVIGQKVGGGYGYKVGEVVGVTSVMVPHKTPLQMLGSLKFGFWASALFLMVLLVSSYLLVRQGLVKPLRMQSRYAELLASSDNLETVRAPMFDKEEASSQNEIHVQSNALKSLHESMQAAMKHIRGLG